MEVQLINVGKRTYRKVCLTAADQKQPCRSQSSEGVYVHDIYEDEGIASCSLSTFTLRMNIGQALVKFVVGQSGATIKTIQSETNSTITIGKADRAGLCPIVIKAPSEDIALSAQTRIDLLIQKGISSSPVTHFVSIPISGGEIQENTRKLYDDIWKTCRDARGVDRSLFLDTEHLHITVTILKLFSDDDVQKASVVMRNLQGYLPSIIGRDPPRILLKGLEYMNDDPSNVDVLYAQVTDMSEKRVLKKICDETIKLFKEASLYVDEKELKIHATILNSLYRARDGNERTPFDARPILDKFSDHYFGSMSLQEMVLAKRGDFEIVTKCKFS